MRALKVNSARVNVGSASITNTSSATSLYLYTYQYTPYILLVSIYLSQQDKKDLFPDT